MSDNGNNDCILLPAALTKIRFGKFFTSLKIKNCGESILHMLGPGTSSQYY